MNGASARRTLNPAALTVIKPDGTPPRSPSRPVLPLGVRARPPQTCSPEADRRPRQPPPRPPSPVHQIRLEDSDDEGSDAVALLLRAAPETTTAPVDGAAAAVLPLLDGGGGDSGEDDAAALLGVLPPSAPTPQTGLAPVPQVPRRVAALQTLPLDELPWAGKRSKLVSLMDRVLNTTVTSDPDVAAAFEPFTSRRSARALEADFDARSQGLLATVPDTITSSSSLVSADGQRTLRDYQMAGVQYLFRNLSRGLSSIVADDMGLGKTAQVCSFLGLLRRLCGAPGPHLVVVPVSTLGGWTQELTRWAPLLQVTRYQGPQRHRYAHVRRGVFLTSPSTVLNDKSLMLKIHWQVVVYDEAHALKNRASGINNAMAKLNAAFRIAVTGTPVSLSPVEVWSLMRFMYPRFGHRLDIPELADDSDDEEGHEAQREELRSQVSAVFKHIMLRRTKDTVPLALPRRHDLPVQLVTMGRFQRSLYRTVLLNRRKGEGMQSMLTNLQRVTCHPWLFRVHLAKGGAPEWREDRPAGLERLRRAEVPLDEATIIDCSAKMQATDDLLRRIRTDSPGERVLVFSNLTAQLDLLEALCHLRGYTFDRLDGESSRSERELLMSRFNHPKSTIFCLLISTTAGGVGITLTGANHVLLYDSHFNPQMDRQAADRAHRIGQTRPVYVHRLSCADSFEQRAAHRAAARATVGDTCVDGAVQREYGLPAQHLRQLINDEVRAIEASQCHEQDMQAAEAFLNDLVAVRAVELMDLGGKEKASADGTVDLSSGGRTCQWSSCFACRSRNSSDDQNGTAGDDELKIPCTTCAKRYHLRCVGMKSWPKDAHRWVCPRHRCTECGVRESEDALFACTGCPNAYCVDCLDQRYLAMEQSVDGIRHPMMSRSYEGMMVEGDAPRRRRWYIQCLSCSGEISDSSDDDGVSGDAFTSSSASLIDSGEE